MAEAAQKTSQSSPGAQPGQVVDPIRNYAWKILIGGQEVGSFILCSGIDITVDSIDYYEGGSPHARKIPGRVYYAPITLEYGLTQSRRLWDWMDKSAKQGPQGADRQNVSIVLLGPDGNEHLLQWNLYNAWPSKLKAKPMDAALSQFLVVSLELTFDYAEQD